MSRISLLLGFLATAFIHVASAADAPAKFGALAAGTPAPDFTVVGRDGKEIRFSDFQRHTVILNFWAPNRGPADALQAAFSSYRELDVMVLGVCSAATREE